VAQFSNGILGPQAIFRDDLGYHTFRCNFSLIGDSNTLFYHQGSYRSELILERERETCSWLSNRWCKAFKLSIRAYTSDGMKDWEPSTREWSNSIGRGM